MIRTVRRGLPTLLLAYLLLFGPALISAPTTLNMSARAEVQAPAYDEATLEKFAIAAREIVTVRKEYEPLIRTAPNAEIAQALSEDARARMDAAFSTAGITPEQYLEIAQAAQTNTALRERIGEMLEE